MKFSKATNSVLSLIMVIIIFAISIATLLIISFSMRKIYLNSMADMTNIATRNIEDHIRLHENECNFIANMRSFKNYMTHYEEKTTSTPSALLDFSQTFDYIFRKVESMSTIDAIVIADTNNKIILSDDSNDNDSFLDSDSHYVQNINDGIGGTTIQKHENGEYFILIAQPLKLYDKNIGFLFMELSFDMINSLIDSYRFGDTGNLFLITSSIDFIGNKSEQLPTNINNVQNNQNIFKISGANKLHSYDVFTTTFKTDKTDRYMVYSTLHNLNAIIATSIEKSQVNKTGLTTAFPLIFLLTIIIVMIMTYRFVISRKILHPLSLLERSLYMLKKGDLRARYNYNAVNEFGNLSTVFNQTISNLQQATQNLKEREDKNGIILSNITDVVWEYNIETYTVTMPENWTKLIKLESKKNEYKYKLDEFMDFIHINDAVEFSQRINNCIKNNTPIKFECQLKQSDDNYVWIRINGSCMFNIYNEPCNIIGSIFDISDTKNREDALKDFAKRDDMTNLLRKVEMERIVNADMKRNGLGHSLMILDLDGFKSINDTYGHLIGDEIIINTARVLERHCKNDCYICRFGGDEFIIYTKLVYSSEQTKILAQTIIDDIHSDYIASDGTVIKSSCSIGIARSPIHGNNYAQLMLKADNAIYEVKKRGKNNFAFYDDSLQK